MRSTRVPVHLSSPVLRSRPSKTSSASETGVHLLRMSSRLTKKSLVSASGCFVKTPCPLCPALTFSARRPPTSTVISGGQRHQVRLVDKQRLRRDAVLDLD